MRRELTALVIVFTLVSAGCFGTTGPDATDEPETSVPPETADRPSTTDESETDSRTPARTPSPTRSPSPTRTPSPPDPAGDRLGWENGYWYNESIRVTREDGYNGSEVDRILARSMARVERIRGLEFDETPDVSLVPREEYAEYTSERLSEAVDEGITTRERLYWNTKFEALLTVPEDESYFRDIIANRGEFAGAFYTQRGIEELGVSERSIAIIVPEGGNAAPFRESTLGHELVHRLQDTNLGVLDTFRGGSTEEARNVNTSLTEADATLVDERYAERCEAEWECLEPPERASPQEYLRENFENPGLGVYWLGPYSETATLFAAADERGGVEAMNGIYDDPPASTEQLLHPDAYPEDTPTEINYTDRSTDEWSMPYPSAPPETFGEMGIFLMLWYPSFDTGSTVVMDHNYTFEGVDPPGQVDFTHPASEGWDGDEMFIYTSDDSAETNETAYVWETRWDSETDAAEFADAYVRILTEYGNPVDGREDTYRIPDDHPYGDAFHVSQDGDTVTIVNAPTVEDLGDVHAPAGE